MIDQLLSDYARAEKAIHAHFGYRPEWREYPVRDERGQWWFVYKNCLYHQYKRFPHDEGNIRLGNFCKSDVSAVNRSDDGYTLLTLDTRTDGNKCLSIFENAFLVDPLDADPLQYYG